MAAHGRSRIFDAPRGRFHLGGGARLTSMLFKWGNVLPSRSASFAPRKANEVSTESWDPAPDDRTGGMSLGVEPGTPGAEEAVLVGPGKRAVCVPSSPQLHATGTYLEVRCLPTPRASLAVFLQEAWRRRVREKRVRFRSRFSK